MVIEYIEWRYNLVIHNELLPGTSGVLSPFGKIEGLYFNDSNEPNDYEYNFKQDLDKLLENENVEYIKIKTENKDDYYKLLDMLTEFNKNAITVSATSRENYAVIVEEAKDLDADQNASDTTSWE